MKTAQLVIFGIMPETPEVASRCRIDPLCYGEHLMPHATRCLAWALLAMPVAATATLVNRCEATDGSVTFTNLSCSPDARMTRYRAHHPPLGSVPAMLPERESAAMPSRGAVVTIITPATSPRRNGPEQDTQEKASTGKHGKRTRYQPPR
jgi:hypothetical protein